METQNFLETILLSIAIGFVPAYIWLRFWLSEDELHHEPKKTIIVSFIAGLVSVALAIVIQKALRDYLGAFLPSVTSCSFILIFIFAAAEEVSKFVMCYIAALRTKADAYPIDPVLYLITTALGFAALENTLYIYNLIATDGLGAGTSLSIIRFFGASLLHVLSSGVIGIFLSYAFYKNPARQIEMGFLGLGFASLIHGLFNYLILFQTEVYGCSNIRSGSLTFFTFAAIWIAIIIVILLLERIKRITKPKVK